MINYRYPENLAAKPVLWLWYLRDIGVIGIGSVLSVLLVTQTGVFIPLVFVAIYAFLSIRFDQTSILDFIKYACSYFILKQQIFYWSLESLDINKQHKKQRKKGRRNDKKQKTVH